MDGTKIELSLVEDKIAALCKKKNGAYVSSANGEITVKADADSVLCALYEGGAVMLDGVVVAAQSPAIFPVKAGTHILTASGGSLRCVLIGDGELCQKTALTGFTAQGSGYIAVNGAKTTVYKVTNGAISECADFDGCTYFDYCKDGENEVAAYVLDGTAHIKLMGNTRADITLASAERVSVAIGGGYVLCLSASGENATATLIGSVRLVPRVIAACELKADSAVKGAYPFEAISGRAIKRAPQILTANLDLPKVE